MNKGIVSLRRQLFIPMFALLCASQVPCAHAMQAVLLQDAYVDSTKSTTANLFSAGSLRTTKSGTQTCRTFMQFSLATLPSGTTATNIVQAWLRVWVNSSTTVLGSVTITPVTSTWKNSTITYSNISSMTFGSPQIANQSINSTASFVAIDITPLVKAWVSGSVVNQGFAIDAASGVTNLNLYFDAQESTATSHEPQLEIGLASVGPQGPAGPAGPQGPTGAPGVQGPAGSTGAQGPAGPTGSQGATGATGQTGAQGPVGPVGPKGLNWKGAWSSSTAYAVNDAVSNSGSAYVALQANTNAPPPLPGTWGLLVQKGDVGATGPAGSSGAQGPAGPTGPAGAVGQTGPQGSAGSPGAAGAQGPAGPLGPAGPQGPAGPIGQSGLQGPSGPTGAPGATGPAGPVGPAPTRIQPQGDLLMGAYTQGTAP